jgi:hypothetical protein
VSSRKNKYSIRLEVENGKVVRSELTGVGKDGEKAFKKISSSGIDATKNLGLFKKSVKGLSGLKSIIFNLKTAFVSLVGAAGIGAATKASLDYASELKNLSDTANLATTALQEYRFVGLQLGIDQDAIIDGFKELSLRADEFAQTLGGPAAESFARLGLSVKDVKSLMGDTDKFFEVVIGRMRELDEAAQIRIADELFGGTGGEKFVRIVQESAGSIASMRDEAQSLGLVLSEDVIHSADEANKRFKVLSEVLRVNLLSSFVDNADEIEAFANTVIENIPVVLDHLRKLSEFLGLMREPASYQALDELDSKIAKIQQRLESGPNLGEKLRDSFLSPTLGGAYDTLSGGASPTQNRRSQELNDLLLEREEIISQLEQRDLKEKRMAALSSGKESFGPFKNTPSKSLPSGGVSLASDIQKQARANEKLTQELERQITTVTTSERAQFVEAQSRKLNESATKDQIVSVENLAGALYDTTEAHREYEQDVNNLSSAIDGHLNNALDGNLRTWEDWRNGIMDFVADVAGEILKIQFGGTGQQSLSTSLAEGILGVFGGGSSDAIASSGGRASGGPVKAGRLYRVNEIRDEFFKPAVDGHIMPLGPSAPGVGATPVIVNVHNNGNSKVGVSQNQRGGAPNIDVIVEEIENNMSRNIGQGRGLAPIIEGRYGVNPSQGAYR